MLLTSYALPFPNLLQSGKQKEWRKCNQTNAIEEWTNGMFLNDSSEAENPEDKIETFELDLIKSTVLYYDL